MTVTIEDECELTAMRTGANFFANRLRNWAIWMNSCDPEQFGQSLDATVEQSKAT
jgi:hypothetical protein